MIDYLSSKLPAYVIPNIFKRVESFIQAENGNIDRKRVLECTELKVHNVMSVEFYLNDLNDVQRKILI